MYRIRTAGVIYMLPRSALLLVLASFVEASALGAQQSSRDLDPGIQPAQSQPQDKQLTQVKTAPSSDQSSTSSVKSAASSVKPLTTVVVNGGPSADILRSARNAGYKIKVVNGTTHFCKTEAPIGTRFASESCIGEGQLVLFLHRAQDQRDEIKHLLGSPENSK